MDEVKILLVVNVGSNLISQNIESQEREVQRLLQSWSEQRGFFFHNTIFRLVIPDQPCSGLRMLLKKAGMASRNIFYKKTIHVVLISFAVVFGLLVFDIKRSISLTSVFPPLRSRTADFTHRKNIYENCHKLTSLYFILSMPEITILRI